MRYINGETTVDGTKPERQMGRALNDRSVRERMTEDVGLSRTESDCLKDKSSERLRVRGEVTYLKRKTSIRRKGDR